jgi:deoxycytidylate deaminase
MAMQTRGAKRNNDETKHQINKRRKTQEQETPSKRTGRKVLGRFTWLDTLVNQVCCIAMRSSEVGTKVGCISLSNSFKIIGQGYNAESLGIDDNIENKTKDYLTINDYNSRIVHDQVQFTYYDGKNSSFGFIFEKGDERKNRLLVGSPEAQNDVVQSGRTRAYGIVHAEMNCLLFGNRILNGDDWLLVTLLPCPDCLKHIIQMNVKFIIYINDKGNYPGTWDLVRESNEIDLIPLAGIMQHPKKRDLISINNINLLNSCTSECIEFSFLNHNHPGHKPSDKIAENFKYYNKMNFPEINKVIDRFLEFISIKLIIDDLITSSRVL